MDEKCVDHTLGKVAGKLCYCKTNLCNSVPNGIKCYIGAGIPGSKKITKSTLGKFKSCSNFTASAEGTTVSTYAGLATVMDEKCVNHTLANVEGKICYCKTNLCNSAPAVVQALMPIIAMALCVKFIN
ncbi:unnamed protein product [Meganyctiphanes norvegica]|uniref:Uncharacterized protein n=1 Tax=Meganyctiphanes norvegica TaxID=48144 RepID=A0AAV2R503_MEGNR